jgi:hypothetical protein
VTAKSPADGGKADEPNNVGLSAILAVMLLVGDECKPTTELMRCRMKDACGPDSA